MRNLLVIAGPLSGYLFALYRAVARDWPCAVHLIHEPLPESVGFAHEQVSFDDFRSLDWTKATGRELARFVRCCRPDVVVIHGTRPARAMGVALVILPRTTPVLFASDANICELVSHRGKLLSRMAAYAALFSRVHTTLSLGLSNELALRLLGARSIRRLPIYAIDFDAFDQARDGTPAVIPGELKRLAIVARLVEAKNLAGAIEAVSSDAELRNGVMLSFVGDGPLRADLEVLARRRQVKAEFLGAVPRSQVGATLARADALLLPSTQEPWGIVVCEALGMGIPVVASPAVGAAISLAGDTNAVIVASSPSVPDFANSMRTFLSRAGELTVAARRSASRVRREYSLPDVTQRLVALLQQVTAGA